MILRRLVGGEEAYYTSATSRDLQVIRLYVEEADDPGMRRAALPAKIAL
jgi:hypothetical protein